MPYTRLGDLQIPENFAEYVVQETVNRNRFTNCGLVEFNAGLTEFARQGGFTGHFPFYNQLNPGVVEDLDQDVELTINNVTTGRESYFTHARGVSFGSQDLNVAFNNNRNDPIGAIAGMMGTFWSNNLNTDILATLQGVFGDVTMADHIEDAIGNPLDGSIIIDAAQRIGDASSDLSIIIMHSITYAHLKKLQLIDFLREVDSPAEIPFYLGKRVVVDDSVPFDTIGNETISFLAAPGAIQYAANLAKIPYEIGRNKLLGLDYMVSRSQHILFPRGFACDASAIAGITPTRTEVADGTVVFERVVDPKLVKLVAILHDATD